MIFSILLLTPYLVDNPDDEPRLGGKPKETASPDSTID